MKILFGTIAALTLSGCATLSQDECNTLDWFELGQQDGASGQSLTRANSHARACAKHGITIDLGQYRNGYDLGLPRFCTTDTGFEAGARGDNLPQQCAATASYREMRAAFAKGQMVMEKQKVLDQLTSEQNQIRTQISALSDQIRANEPDAEVNDTLAQIQNDLQKQAVDLELKIEDQQTLIKELRDHYYRY